MILEKEIAKKRVYLSRLRRFYHNNEKMRRYVHSALLREYAGTVGLLLKEQIIDTKGEIVIMKRTLRTEKT